MAVAAVVASGLRSDTAVARVMVTRAQPDKPILSVWFSVCGRLFPMEERVGVPRPICSCSQCEQLSVSLLGAGILWRLVGASVSAW